MLRNWLLLLVVLDEVSVIYRQFASTVTPHVYPLSNVILLHATPNSFDEQEDPRVLLEQLEPKVLYEQ